MATYDVLGRLSVLTDTTNQATAYQYDGNSNLRSLTDALQQTTVYTYDVANQSTGMLRADGSSTGVGYDLDGNVITQTNGLGRNTLFTNDPLGRLLSQTDPLTRTTRYGYDYAGNRTTLTDPLSRIITSTYDALNRLNRLSYSDGVTPHVAYTYSPTGQRLSMADDTGTTIYQYDGLDRVITTTTGAGNQVVHGYNATDDVTQLTYPDGSVVTRTYYVLDRPITVTDWLGNTTGFAYDANSNVITQTYPNTTTALFSYDAMNRITGIVDKAGSAPFITDTYTRDGLGRLVSNADSLQGVTHTYGYDKLNRLTSDSAGGTISTTWAYNAAGSLTQTVAHTVPQTTTQTYDLADGLTHLSTISGTTQTVNDTVSSNADGATTVLTDSISGLVLSYGYDQADRLITATNGSTASSYVYNGDGLRQSKTVAGTIFTET